MNPETAKTNKFVTAAVMVMAGITLYWAFTYSGPYRYLAELQVKWFGYYVPKLTALVIILGFLFVAGAIKVVLRGAERPVPGTTNTSVEGSGIKAAAVPQPSLRYVRYIAP